MSAGPFILRFYEADSGDTHVIRTQPETAVFSIGGAPNVIPAGPATSEFWAEVGRGNTEYGLRPRKLRIRWTAAPPEGYSPNATLEVVVFSPAAYNSATLLSSATYLGAAAQIVGKVPENIYPGI
jgi:hypothetical protein